MLLRKAPLERTVPFSTPARPNAELRRRANRQRATQTQRKPKLTAKGRATRRLRPWGSLGANRAFHCTSRNNPNAARRQRARTRNRKARVRLRVVRVAKAGAIACAANAHGASADALRGQTAPTTHYALLLGTRHSCARNGRRNSGRASSSNAMRNKTPRPSGPARPPAQLNVCARARARPCQAKCWRWALLRRRGRCEHELLKPERRRARRTGA